MTNTNQPVVLVTGSSSGLGYQLAHTLVTRGYIVIATMRNLATRNAEAAASLQAAADGQTGTLHLVEMDVTDEGSVVAAVNEATEKAGRIDVVVNNAGVGGGGYTEAFSTAQFERTFDVNVLGVQRVMRAVLPGMRERGSGLIVNISSAMGRIVVPYAGAYTASKYALEGLSESYRYELANTGVDAVIAEPGGFGTGYWTSMMPPEDTERVKSYGDESEVPASFWSGVGGMVSGAEAGDPQGFADAMVDLIETPAGQRPLRLVIDPITGGGGPKAVNETSEAVQREVLAAFGLDGLLSALPAESS